MSYYNKLLVFFAVLTIAVSHPHVHFYRKDYTFFEKYDAFYKLHSDPNVMSWNDAFLACDGEGAKLFYPVEEDELQVANTLMARTLPDISDFLVGVRDEFGLGEFMTVDGHPTSTPLNSEINVESGPSCVVINFQSGQYKVESCESEQDAIRPFICKKVDERPACPTIDGDYMYNQKTKKCYKVNNRRKTWQDAMHTCYVEGGTLAVVDDNEEIAYIKGMLSADNNYFVGFHRILPGGDFYTVKGKILHESGFQSILVFNDDRSENCGIISNRNYNSFSAGFVNCRDLLPFVCELQADV